MRTLYVKLSTRYWLDPKLRRAGTAAELLFVRGLAWSKSESNDGGVHAAFLPVLGAGLPGDLADAVAALVDEGLWVKTEEGWTAAAWAVWQFDADDVEAKRAAARERQRKHRSKPPTNGAEPPSEEAVTPPSQGVTRGSRARNAVTVTRVTRDSRTQTEAETEAEGEAELVDQTSRAGGPGGSFPPGSSPRASRAGARDVTSAGGRRSEGGRLPPRAPPPDDDPHAEERSRRLARDRARDEGANGAMW